MGIQVETSENTQWPRVAHVITDVGRFLCCTESERGFPVPSDEELIPLTRAIAELRLGYAAGRNMALRGELALTFIGTRLYVSRSSLELQKTKRASSHDRVSAPAVEI